MQIINFLYYVTSKLIIITTTHPISVPYVLRQNILWSFYSNLFKHWYKEIKKSNIFDIAFEIITRRQMTLILKCMKPLIALRPHVIYIVCSRNILLFPCHLKKSGEYNNKNQYLRSHIRIEHVRVVVWLHLLPFNCKFSIITLSHMSGISVHKQYW